MLLRLGLSNDVIFSAIIALVGLATLGVGGVLSYQTHFRHPKYRYIPAGEEWQSYLAELIQAGEKNIASDQAEDSQAKAGPEEKFLVDVSGGVVKPGVYAVSSNGRLQDVILMAGGFRSDVDQRYVHQEINLSSRVKDQQKIYIPLEGEEILASTSGSGMSDDTAQSQANNSTPGLTEKISLRTASSDDLEELDGIGEKRAASILAGYPYKDEADFLERSGLSANMAQELLDNSISLQ